jgi:DNA invertase Pin-like site-specific DNA recombinase
MIVIAYIRCSRDDADPARQRAMIQAWLDRHGITEVIWLEDIGGRRHEAANARKRPKWQEALRRCRAGGVGVLVVEETSRLGFATEWELVGLGNELRGLGTNLVEASSGRVINGSDDTALVLTSVAGLTSRRELEQLASRSLGQRIARAKSHGTYQGGVLNHGFCLECRGPAGVACWWLEIAPDGRKSITYSDGTRTWHEPDYNPSRREGELLYQVPSRLYPERIDDVRSIFTWYLSERVSLGVIARRLNEMKHYPAGGVWYSSRVQDLLRLPTYTGYPAFGRRRSGRYAAARDGRVGAGGRESRVARAEWIWADKPVFQPAIISRADWERAQEKMETECLGPRAGKNPELVLSGLVICSRCGQRMSGSRVRTPGREEHLIYLCSTYLTHHGPVNPTGCKCHRVRQDTILQVIDEWLEETGQTLAGTGTERGLLAALYSDRAGTRQALREAREALEAWLEQELQQVCQPEPMPGGRRRYAVGHHEVVLPGGNPDVVWELAQWIAGATGAADQGRRAALESEHDALVRALVLAPTERTRDKISGEVKRIEAELSALDAGPRGLLGRLRGLAVESQELAVRLTKARSELGRQDLRRRALAYRELIDRIVVRHGPVGMRAGKPISKVVEIRLEPRVSSEVCVPPRTG